MEELYGKGRLVRVMYALIPAIMLFLGSAFQSSAQCANDNIFFTDLTPSGVGVGFAETTDVIYGGEYATVTVCEGATYTFSTCAEGYDTQLTLYTNGGGYLGYDDDGCGTFAGPSFLTWTATLSGVVRILVDEYPCTSNSVATTLTVTQTTACPSGECANNNVFFTDLTPSGIGAGGAATTTAMYAGEYATVEVCAGATYTFSTCAETYDTQITLFEPFGSVALDYDDDGCGTFAGPSFLTWTADYDGTLWVLVDQYPCLSNTILTTLTVTQTTACPAVECANNNTYFTDLTPTGVGAGGAATTTVMYAGEYAAVEVCSGATYTFSTCAETYDTQITLYEPFGSVALDYDDDGCGTFAGPSFLTWTADYDGIVWVLVDQYPCVSNTIFTTLTVTQTTACPANECTNNNVYFTDLTPVGVGPNNAATTTVMYAGEYVTVDVCDGATYTFSTCGETYDSQITLYEPFGSTPLDYDDDGCGTFAGPSFLTWTSDFDGTIWVLVDQYPCVSNSTFTTLTVTQTTACPSGGCDVTDVYVDFVGCEGDANWFNYQVYYTGACTVDYMWVWTEDTGWEMVDLTFLGIQSGDDIGIYHYFDNSYYEFYFVLSDGTETLAYFNYTNDCSGPGCIVDLVTAEGLGCDGTYEAVDFYIYYSGCYATNLNISIDGVNWDSYDVSTLASGDPFGLFLFNDNTEYIYYYDMSDGSSTGYYYYFTGPCDGPSCSNLSIDYEEGECLSGTPSGTIYFDYIGDCTVVGVYSSVDGGAFGFLDLTAYNLGSGESIELLFNYTDSAYEVYYELSDGSISPSVFFNTSDCLSGETICDCMGTQLPIEALSWLGDGLLDDGSFNWDGVPVNFDCALWGFDCGDNTEVVGYDPYGVCSGSLPPANGCVVEECYLTYLEVYTDCFPDETNVYVFNENGDLVIAQGEEWFILDDNVYYTTLCLPPGCYTYTITDDFGDGLLCESIEGYFGVFDGETGEYYVYGVGDFGDSYTEEFCVGQQTTCSNLDLTITNEPCNGNDGTLDPMVSYEFDFTGACTVATLYLSENGGPFDAYDVTIYDWASGDGGVWLNLTENSSFAMYYELSDGSISQLFVFETGDCNNETTICDCDGTTHTIGVLSWLGDGLADNGFYQWAGQYVNFNCATWGYDCGDIAGAPTLDPYNVCEGGLPPSNGCVNEILGCTDPEAINYNPDATVNDGSCIYNILFGCTDSEACNYNPQAQVDNGSCEYVSCAGCTDPDATNYDPTATIDDGSCFYEEIEGCTDEEALNYNPLATQDDGSCIFNCQWPSVVYTTTCVQGDTENFIIEMDINTLGNGAPYVITNSYNDEQYNLNFTGVIELGPFPNDAQVVVQVVSSSLDGCFITSPILTEDCTAGVIEGCTDILASNYNPAANDDDGSCAYDFVICDCEGEQFSPAERFQLGDGIANNGAGNLPNFNCAAWGYDCGDISGAPTDDPYGVCSGNLPPLNGCEDNVAELESGLISIYPNPNNGSFTLMNGGLNGPLMMRIYDAAGRLVEERQLVLTTGASVQLNLDKLSGGSYRMSIMSDTRIEYHQLIIQR